MNAYLHTLLRLEIACVLFVERYFVIGQANWGNSSHLSRVQQVVFKPVTPRTLQAACYKPPLRDPIATPPVMHPPFLATRPVCNSSQSS